MSRWLDGALSRAENINDWLAPKRRESLRLLRATPWPTRKTEAWKYTPLTALAEQEFAVPAQPASVEVAAIEGLASLNILVIDGRIVTDLSVLRLIEGLSITSLSKTDNAWVEQNFAQVKPARHLFGLVNDVLATEGLVIEVADGIELTQPIRIVSQISGGCEAHFRVMVRLGEGSKATVIEQFAGDQPSFNTSVAEFDIAASASLEHYRFALQTDVTLSVGGDHFRLGSRANLNSTVVGYGSALSRVDVDIHHAGDDAQAKLNAIYLLDGNETFDLHSTIEHAAVRGTTEENVRGIVAGSSKAVFNGRIHIHRHAQKTSAQLNNRNLLMSRQAEIYTKPELEIYADDVRCAHGATIAEIDKKSLYYLQSRGVDRAMAQAMLSFGFINELIDEMPNEALAEWLRPQLRQRFGRMSVK